MLVSASRRNRLRLKVSSSRAVSAFRKVAIARTRSPAPVTRALPRKCAYGSLRDINRRGHIFGFVERLDLLSVALGLAALAGVNLYLTVFATGLAIHFHWITLAPQYQSLEVLGNPWIISIAGVLYSLEFFADKIPWVDSIWDAVHTVIRPIGGALLAIQVLGHPSPAFTVIVALLGGRHEPPCAHGESSDTARQQYIAGTAYKYRAKPWRRRCGAGRPDSRASQSLARLDHLSNLHRRLLVFCAKNLALD